MVIRSPTILRSLVRTPARTIPRPISQLEIHSVYQAVIGTGFTWQCGGIAQLVELLIPGVSHIFRIVWIIIPACLIKQPNGTLSRMYVQTYISVK